MSNQSHSNLRDDPIPPASPGQPLVEAAGRRDPESSASPSPYPRAQRQDRGALGSCYGRERHRLCSYLSFQRIVCPCQQLETTGGVGEEAGRQTDRQLPSKTPRNSWSRGRLCLAVGQVQAGKAFQTTSVTMPPQPQQNSFCQVRLTE